VLEGRSSSLSDRPSLLRHGLDGFAWRLLQPSGSAPVDFSRPFGEEALARADSISWQVFKNPVALFVGGVAAVILELAEPRVGTAIWQHSTFRTDPLKRLQRTGLAAMMTIYGARGAAQEMIARVVRIHEKINGVTPSGQEYRAGDPELLGWVHATATFGFSEAYNCYARSLPAGERNSFCAEAVPAAILYGVTNAPTTWADLTAQLDCMREKLEPSPIIHEFLRIMGGLPLLPSVLRPMQRMLVRAAVEIIPTPVRDRLELPAACGLQLWEVSLMRRIGGAANALLLPSLPAAQACIRLGLPADYLYRRGGFDGRATKSTT
jgi:uncharacterized protein (DUF2236 family)